MTPEQQSTFLDHVVALESKRTDEDRMVYTIKLIAYVTDLLAQARADAFEAAAKVCDKRAQSRTGYAYDGAEQDEAEACAAEIRAQGQGQGGGNG